MIIMSIIPIPAFKDNYIWLIQHQQFAVVMDPGDAQPVLNKLDQQQLTLTAILITHHHADHCAGISQLLQHQPVPVYGPALENIPHRSHPCSEANTIELFNQQLYLQIIDIPGHTSGHIGYYADGILFCGDTLFTGGCGRLFEGSANELYNSLNKLAVLPDETLIYCGHEYTLKNLQFALTVEPNNVFLQQRYQQTLALRAQHLPTVPAPLSLEKLTNPFLRAHLPHVKTATEQHCQQRLDTPVSVFEQLRIWKDQF
jgi:hydroxyacylglutathione hydrolase